MLAIKIHNDSLLWFFNHHCFRVIAKRSAQVSQCYNYSALEGNSPVLDKACVLISDVNTLHNGAVFRQESAVLVRQEGLCRLRYLGGEK